MANISVRGVDEQALRRLRQAGTWTAADARQFERATATFGHVDEDLWR